MREGRRTNVLVVANYVVVWCAPETNLGGIAVDGDIAPAGYTEVRWLDGDLAMHIGMLTAEDGDEGWHRGIRDWRAGRRINAVGRIGGSGSAKRIRVPAPRTFLLVPATEATRVV